jgi:hypothetical protein
MKVRGIEVEECKVMESKKKPLWLTLHNANRGAENIVLMLKVGDDLRQDILILQLLRVMDAIWRREGLEMQMMLYNCISTGFERGLLQVSYSVGPLIYRVFNPDDIRRIFYCFSTLYVLFPCPLHLQLYRTGCPQGHHIGSHSNGSH